jgi:hypothetical protein
LTLPDDKGGQCGVALMGTVMRCRARYIVPYYVDSRSRSLHGSTLALIH